MVDDKNIFPDLISTDSVNVFNEKLKWVKQHWQNPPSRIAGNTVEEKRASLLVELANSSLRSQGVPPLTGAYGIEGLTSANSYGFHFDRGGSHGPKVPWTMGIDARVLKQDNFSDHQFQRIAGLVYHEARHVQQYYWVAVQRSRVQGRDRPPNSDVKPPIDEVVVPQFIIDIAQQDTRAFTTKQHRFVERLFAENISPYVAAGEVISPRARAEAATRAGGQAYIDLWQERDAYYAHKLVYPTLSFRTLNLNLPSKETYDDPVSLNFLDNDPHQVVDNLDFYADQSDGQTIDVRAATQREFSDLYATLGVTTSADGVPRTTLGDPSRLSEELATAFNQVPDPLEPHPPAQFTVVQLLEPESGAAEQESRGFEQALNEHWQQSIQASLTNRNQRSIHVSGLELG